MPFSSCHVVLYIFYLRFILKDLEFLIAIVNTIFFHIFFSCGIILKVDLVSGNPIELFYWSYIINFKLIL